MFSEHDLPDDRQYVHPMHQMRDNTGSLGLTVEDVNILSEIQKATYLKCFANTLKTPQGEFDNTLYSASQNAPIQQRHSTADTRQTRVRIQRGLH